MSPEYLEAAGTRLLEGRDVSWQDTTQTPPVAIVNETFARTMWGDSPAIGQRFILRERSTEVVGVVEDGKYYNLMESPAAAVFVPLAQNTGGAVLVVRSSLAADRDRRGAAPRRWAASSPTCRSRCRPGPRRWGRCCTRRGRRRSRWASWASSR